MRQSQRRTEAQSKNKLSSRTAATSNTQPVSLTRKLVTIGIIIVIAAAALLTVSVMHGRQAAKQASSVSCSDDVSQKLKRHLALPGDRTITQLDSWKLACPPDGHPVFNYVDKIESVTVNINQQILPVQMRTNTDKQVTELAKELNAMDEIEAGSTAVHIGTSAKGPQTVVFAKNGLLILMKSHKVITDQAWAKYVTSLT